MTFTGVPLLMPLCAGFLEPRKSTLRPSKSTFNAKNFICSLSMSISIGFSAIRFWKVSRSPKSPKSHKNPYFSVQGHPTSLKSVTIESQCMTSY